MHLRNVGRSDNPAKGGGAVLRLLCDKTSLAIHSSALVKPGGKCAICLQTVLDPARPVFKDIP